MRENSRWWIYSRLECSIQSVFK